jgi:hypothetical protein
MFWNDTHRDNSRMTNSQTHGWRIAFDRHVFEYMLHELGRYPNSEEGGKYLGYIQAPKVGADSNFSPTIIITDFLPGGPNAKRTAVEFFPDSEFQEGLFRKAERRDPEIEHVGTWHSHHCNGLQELSGGDIAGYFKTVQKRDYRPEVFIASLVKRLPRNSRDTDWLDHFLFARGDKQFYKITSEIILVDSRSKFLDITGHNGLASDNHQHLGLWNESETGRDTLATDKKLFAERFGTSIRAVRRDGIISISCTEGQNMLAVTYPAALTDRNMSIEVRGSHGAVFHLTCDYSNRRTAYAACFEALNQISTATATRDMT